MKSILLIKKFWGLVEMTFRPVNASFSLPEWQAVKNDFLCTLKTGMVWHRFGLKTSIDFAHFGLESGLQLNYGSV